MTTASKIILSFYECEHDGDSSQYEEDLIDSGGYTFTWHFDFEAGSASVSFFADDSVKFFKEFEKTESFEFLD